MENFDEVIKLIDEQGNEVDFELVMTIEANNNNYAILAPMDSDDEEEDEAYIFRVELDEDGEMLLEAIEDDEEYQMVVDVYETLVAE